MIDSVLILGGPTGSGKSRIALDLARHFSGEIINADSRQIYQDLVIGTDAPSREIRLAVPHHLFSVIEPWVHFSAADYERLAFPLLKQVQSRNRLPIVVGGTGFYFKALLKGVWEVAGRDDNLRLRLRQIQERRGKNSLHRILKRLDPIAAAEIAPNDEYRVLRALEIFFLTGVRTSQIQKNRPDRFTAWKFFVNLPRSVLLENIRTRIDLMFRCGWVDEVRSLLLNYPEFEQMPAARSLGYRTMIRYLKGGIDLLTCKDEIFRQTSQYAKRQLTWFRNQDQFQPLPPQPDLYKIVESVIQ